MSEYNREGTRDLSAFVSGSGTQLDPVPATGLSLVGGSTYYLPLGNENAPAPSQTSLEAVHLKWDAIFVGVITIETTNFPTRKSGLYAGAFDVADYDAAKGNWIQENPSTGVYISTTSTDATTGAASVAASTVTVAGGTAGGCMIHLGNLGARRTRIKVVVTTGGVVRASFTGKNAA